MTKGHPIAYSEAEIAWLSEHRTLPIGEYAAGFREKFGRHVPAHNLHALRKRRGWKTGRSGQFAKGAEPHNKGKPFAPGRSAGAAAHHFKKGGLPHNTKYLGHERLSKEGYIEISVDEVNPHTGFERRYVLKHRWLWEKANGPVPDGHRLKCVDGNRTNTEPSNWIAIPIALAPRLNGRFGRGYDTAPPELKPMILATARLEHAIRGKRK